LTERLQWLKGQTDLPVCIGFGISQAEQVKHVSGIADGAIVGSAIVRRLAEAKSPSDLDNVEHYVGSLVEALK
ncbi:MAG: tryptophan synthase subunit alpha, partial [Planctomycetota bacterium]|nr:tryptophan synthase subunit alpha [Planctomycetota bacterium]